MVFFFLEIKHPACDLHAMYHVVLVADVSLNNLDTTETFQTMDTKL